MKTKTVRLTPESVKLISEIMKAEADSLFKPTKDADVVMVAIELLHNRVVKKEAVKD